jgi:hypothetical protein
MTNKPKAIGTAGETAVVRFLGPNGFSGAERSALHGGQDQGDITGTPGVAWEVKAGHVAEVAADGSLATWLAQTEAERLNRGADVAVLVLKRKGRGAARAGEWWAYLPGWAFVMLARLPLPAVDKAHPWQVWEFTYRSAPIVRITLAEVVTLLRRAGYGDPLDEVSA